MLRNVSSMFPKFTPQFVRNVNLAIFVTGAFLLIQEGAAQKVRVNGREMEMGDFFNSMSDILCSSCKLIESLADFCRATGSDTPDCLDAMKQKQECVAQCKK